jgi:hypothetical protein
MIASARRSRSCRSGSATEVWCRTCSCFIGLLHFLILLEEPENGETGLAPHIPLQLLHLRLDHQVNRFMGCDCHIELCIKELKSAMGLGQHQVTKDVARVERSVAVAVMAYVLLLRLRAQQISPGRSWSAFTLKHELAWEWGTRQLHRTVRQEARKEIRRQRTAGPPPLRLAA